MDGYFFTGDDDGKDINSPIDDEDDGMEPEIDDDEDYDDEDE